MQAVWVSMAVFALAGAISPGPVNVIASALGATQGFLRALPHVPGATLSYCAVVWLTGSSLQWVLVAYPEIAQVKLHRSFIEDPHYKALAVDHRYNRQPNVDFATMHSKLDPTVLRQSLLSNVQPSHNLKTRNDCRLKPIDFRWCRLIVKDTVDTISND